MPDHIREIRLASVPNQVDIKDLHDNRALLTYREIEMIKFAFAKQADGRYSKNDDLIIEKAKIMQPDYAYRYDIIKQGDELYAIYLGVEHKKELGIGAWAEVVLAQNLKTGEWCALKVQITETNAQKQQREAIKRTKKNDPTGKEQALYDSLKRRASDHKKIISSESKILLALQKSKHGIIKHSKTGKPETYNLLMKHAPGVNLRTFIQSRQHAVAPLAARHWCNLAINILKAVENLHLQFYLHRDLKPDNFVYDTSTGKVVLVDFALTKKMTDGCYISKSKYVNGTPGYIAPELNVNNEGKRIYNTATEVYALGVTLKKLLGFETLDGVINKTIFSSNENLKQFLDRMTSVDPTLRPSLAVCIDYFNQVKKNLIPIQQMTIGILDVNEYLNQPAEARKKFINGLRCVDEVVLIGTNRKNQSNYLEVMQDLRRLDLMVNNSVFAARSIFTVLSQLPEKIAEQKGVGTICQLHYFTTTAVSERIPSIVQHIPILHDSSAEYQKSMQRHSPLVAVRHIQQTVALLEGELRRLQERYAAALRKDDSNQGKIAHSRMGLLEIEYKYLNEHKNKITYTQLFIKLEAIQAQMFATSGFRKWFGWKSAGQKNIIKATDELKTEEHRICRP